MLYFLVYVSSATTLFSRSDLEDILGKSVDYNANLGISGMLLYKDGNVMQVLEGEEEAVRTLYAKIGLDPRHKGLIVIWDGWQVTRQFPSWSMAFRNLNDPDALEAPGYSQFLNTPLTGAEFATNPTLCQQLLTTFKESM